MSLVVNNRAFRESVPQGLELKPSDFRPRLTGIDISFLLDVIANTFCCNIYCDHNVSMVEDVKFFFLGELHRTEFHQRINTLLVRLFATDGDIISHEDQVWGKSEDKPEIVNIDFETEMINPREIQRDVRYNCWDLPNLHQYFYNSGIRIFHLWAMVDDVVKALNERQKGRPLSPAIEERVRRAHFIALKIRKESAAEGNFKMTPMLLRIMLKTKEAKDPVSLKLLEICGAVILTISSRYQMIDHTFRLRQESLSTNIKDSALIATNSFFLAGYKHFFDENETLENSLIPALEETGLGYLATRFEEAIYQEGEILYNTDETPEQALIPPPLSKSDPKYLDTPQHLEDLINFSYHLIKIAAEKEPKVANEFLELFTSIVEQPFETRFSGQ